MANCLCFRAKNCCRITDTEKNCYTNTTKAISYTVSKDKQTSCQDCHFLTFNKSRSPTLPPESWYCSLSCVVFCSNQLLIVGFESSSCRLPKSPSCWPTNKYTSSKVPEECHTKKWLNITRHHHFQDLELAQNMNA